MSLLTIGRDFTKLFNIKGSPLIISHHNSMDNKSRQESILTSIAYHWSEADRAVIHFAKGKRVTKARSSGFTNKRSPASMGRLGPLSLEILHNILEDLDIESLGTMRCLTIQSKNLVEPLPAYRDLSAFARDAITALYSTGLLSEYSARRLYSTLCDQDRCFACNNFGSFLYLPTARRCCFSCIRQGNSRMGVLTVAMAKSQFRLTGQALNQLAVVRTIPGWYRISQKPPRRRFRVVGRHEAQSLGGIWSFSVERMPPSPPVPFQTLLSMVCVAFPYYHVKRRQVDWGVCCRGCECNWCTRDEDFLHRYATEREVYTKRQKTFSRDEFLVHFEGCRSAKMLWDEYISKDRPLTEAVRNTVLRT